MRKVTTIEPYDSSSNHPDVDYFTEARDVLQKLLDNLKKFAESPSSTYGVTHLHITKEKYDYLFDLYGQANAPFCHHSMERLQKCLSPITHYYYSLKNSKDTKPTYTLGRNIEQAIKGVEARIDEWEQCIKYAKSDE